MLHLEGFGLELHGVVAIDDGVDFLVEDVDAVDEVVVLLFAFDEGFLDFLDFGQSGGLIDRVESFVDDLHVALVAVEEFDFFLVVEDQFAQSLLEDGGGVFLDGSDFGLKATSLSQSGFFQLLAEFVEPAAVVALVLLTFHLEAEHHVLVHLANVPAGLVSLTR